MLYIKTSIVIKKYIHGFLYYLLNTRKIIISSILILFLGSCINLGPKYRRPELPTPREFCNATYQQSCEEPWVCWWKVMNDPCLENLIQRAIAHNFDLKIALYNAKEAEAKYLGARSILFPSGTFNFNSLRVNASQDLPFEVPSANYNNFSLKFTGFWEADVLGGHLNSIKGGARAAESTVEKYRNVMLILISELGRTYFTFRSVQSQYEIACKAVCYQEEILKLAKERLKNELSNDLEIAVLEKSVLDAKESASKVKEGLNALLNGLSQIVGELPYSLCNELNSPTLLPNLENCMPPTGLPSELLCRRPDIREAEKILQKTTHDVGAAITQFFPRLDLFTNAGYVSFLLQTLTQVATRNGFYDALVLWPILQAGKLVGNYRATRAKEAQAFYNYAKTLQTAFHEVENHLDGFRKEQERLKMQQSKVTYSESLVKNVGLMGNQGMVPRTEIIKQELLLLNAKNNLIESQQEMAIRLIALYKALGGGWEPFAPDDGKSLETKTPLCPL